MRNTLSFVMALPVIATTILVSPLSAAKHHSALEIFQTSDRCFACHNGLSTAAGEDISIGLSWRPTMMANSARDPYWQAGVRRESMDHPESKKLIEDECSVCHMPMARTVSKAMGQDPQIFAHLPFDAGKPLSKLAQDGVSCSLCHQITEEKLGTKDSYVGGYVVDTKKPRGERAEYGPYEVEKGHNRIMRTSSGGYVPTQGKYFRQSEICATCHTLYTKALGANGQVVGELPEQMPYLEWAESSYKDTTSCQACHMPVVKEEVSITKVLGVPREGVSRHTFIGGNFFMQRMLNKFRGDLSVDALPDELEGAAMRTLKHLSSDTAKLSIGDVAVRDGQLTFPVSVENLSGHKLPTAYPSRRVWLHVTVRDSAGKAIFESGAVAPSGMIQGNDNDIDAKRFEPHYNEITSPDQVQIYEAIMVDQAGALTTGLLAAVKYEKDNRLLPKGLEKAKASADIVVRGAAATDSDFQAGGDKVRYGVMTGTAQGPFKIEAELLFQPIGYRWANNLKAYDAPETKRFTGFWDQMSSGSAAVLDKVTVTK